jgi:hypothetical protein
MAVLSTTISGAVPVVAAVAVSITGAVTVVAT